MNDMETMKQAMMRRFQTNQVQDPNLVLARGLEALKTQSKEVQDEYAPVLIKAQMKAEKQQPPMTQGAPNGSY